MKYKSIAIRKLVQKYREISLLGKVHAVLDWDMNVNLPPKGASLRAEQTALITSLITDGWRNPEFCALFEEALSQSHSKKLTKEEQAIVRNMTHASNYYYKIPKELIVEFSKATSESFMVWQKAKRDDDYELFKPHLAKVIALNRLMADHLGYKDNPYDALLDLYEPGLTSATCEHIFHRLVKEIRPLLSKIQKSRYYDSAPANTGKSFNYSVKRQEQLSLFILRKLGYDLEAGRLDVSPHPFTVDIGRQDVRITTRYSRDDFRESLTSTIHEAGHGLYEQGVLPEYEGTPLASGVSLGIHESQSRFWENQIGRSPEFLTFLTPVLQSFFPEHLATVREHEIVRMFNHVAPSLIRVEADEVTYNLHIALRFEIEHAVINNKVTVDEIPELWRHKMKEYVGVVPETHAAGVLQDVHWSYGSFGYFPTYTLGNLYAAQFMNRMKDEIDIADCALRGELGTILSWLRSNIHTHGSLYWPDELSRLVSGETLNPQYFIDYLNEKYTALYEL